MTEETVVQRIQKLLALAADKGATPAEAEAAAVAANKLMLKFSIDEARLHMSKGEELPNYGHQSITLGKFAAWERDLLVGMAYANLCMLVKIGRETYDVIGHRDNIAVTIEIQTWLRNEIHRLASEAYRRERPANDLIANTAHMDPHRFHTSFKHGAVLSVVLRLQKARRDAEAEQRAARRVEGESTALMVIENRVQVVVHKLYPKLSRGKRSNAGRGASGAAFGAGRLAGDTVKLRPTRELSA